MDDTSLCVIQSQAGPIEAQYAAEGARDSLQQGVPAEAGNDGVVDLQKDPIALLRVSEEDGTSLDEYLQIGGVLFQRCLSSLAFSDIACHGDDTSAAPEVNFRR